ncbi:MAG: hypothetical protein A2078_08560 [Nitrospirae bacterium GWC2_57_9]|nr:MAG: hypothetical protein A2078_08560 [Nitrospirae bacterium GWC2_57_9]
MLFFKNAAVRYVVLAVLSVTPLLAGNVHGHEATTVQFPPEVEGVKKGEFPSGASGFAVQLFPSTPLYAPYIADPHRVGFGLQVLNYTSTEIPHSGNTRFDLRTGGQFGLLRIHPRGAEELGWQISLEGGFNSQFDIDNQLDNIGWDGRYGLVVTTAQTPNLSLKFGYLHDSSHVGDEYAERNGRLRIGYTREELAAGASWLADGGWRTYAEYGHGIVLRNGNLQKPGRAQFGFEWQQPKPAQDRYRGWYGAADLSAMEERDWKIDVSIQSGYRIDTVGKTWRLGVDWYTGRPPIGEFFQHTETYVGFGIWIDI